MSSAGLRRMFSGGPLVRHRGRWRTSWTIPLTCGEDWAYLPSRPGPHIPSQGVSWAQTPLEESSRADCVYATALLQRGGTTLSVSYDIKRHELLRLIFSYREGTGKIPVAQAIWSLTHSNATGYCAGYILNGQRWSAQVELSPCSVAWIEAPMTIWRGVFASIRGGTKRSI